MQTKDKAIGGSAVVMAKEKYTKIHEMRPHQKNITCMLIVIEKLGVTKTKDNNFITQLLVADNTGSIQFSLWFIFFVFFCPSSLFSNSKFQRKKKKGHKSWMATTWRYTTNTWRVSKRGNHVKLTFCLFRNNTATAAFSKVQWFCMQVDLAQ